VGKAVKSKTPITLTMTIHTADVMDRGDRAGAAGLTGRITPLVTRLTTALSGALE